MEYDGRILNPTEEEFNRWLSTQTMRGTIGGGRLSDLAQEQPMQPMNTIRNNATGRVIDMNYATKPLRDLTEADQQAAIEATGGRRTNYDVHIDGPREVARRQLPDGRTEVIREYPALQPTVDGRLNQTSKLVREIETPDYLNPAALKQMDFKLKQAQLEKAQAEAQEGMPTEQASQKYLEKKYGKAGPGFRMTESGVAEPIPGGPADQKAQMKASGAADVDIALGTLRDAYNRLESGGGITSTKKGPIDNLGASISASDIGQVAGKAFGTSNQSARNDIAMSRPALLAALMKATGMSARQMDSNVELKLWITTATDPQLDVEANRRALNNIETKYLGGNKAGNNPAEATPSRPTTSGGNTVTLPDGRTLRFPSGAAAEAFRRKAGL